MKTPADLLPVATEAVDIARGIVQARRVGTVTPKGDRDMATEVDFTVEETVRKFLRERTPSIGFLGEEEGSTDPERTTRWVLDPVDGTANFIHGIPMCGTSLALLQDDRPVLGVVDLPFLGLRYSATLGNGAFCNGARMQTALPERLEDAIVSIGDYAVGDRAQERNERRLEITRRLAGRVLRVRMFGSAATDLVWVAEGRTSVCVILSNKPWDMAAGVVIAREAGAHVVDVEGNTHDFRSTSTVAASPSILKDLLSLLQDPHPSRG